MASSWDAIEHGPGDVPGRGSRSGRSGRCKTAAVRSPGRRRQLKQADQGTRLGWRAALCQPPHQPIPVQLLEAMAAQLPPGPRSPPAISPVHTQALVQIRARPS